MAQQEEGHIGAESPDVRAARGGCLKLGWGCLPLFAGLCLLVPASLWLH